MKRNLTNMLDENPSQKLEIEQQFKHGIVVKKNKNKKQVVVFANKLWLFSARVEKLVKQILKDELKNNFKIKSHKSFLIVGLGNKSVVNDSLGPKVVERLVVSRGLKLKPSVCVFEPNVFSNTGIETSQLVCCVCKCVKPNCVIIIDSLATTSISRLCNCFQIAEGGITAGSGSGAKNKEISKQSLGVECVVSIGVPMLVFANKLCAQNEFLPQDLILSPTDSEKTVNLLADVIAAAINETLFENLLPSEIKTLVR